MLIPKEEYLESDFMPADERTAATLVPDSKGTNIFTCIFVSTFRVNNGSNSLYPGYSLCLQQQVSAV